MTDQASSALDDARALLDQATAAYRQADFSRAKALAEEALALVESSPEDVDEARRAVLLDNAYRRVVEALDRQSEFGAADQALWAWERATRRSEGRVDVLALGARLSYRRGNFEQALRYIDEGSSLAQSCGYALGLAALFRYRADILWMRGQPEGALTLAKQALTLYERLDDQEGRARTLNTIAAIYHTMSNFYQSIRYSLQAIKVLEALGDRLGLSVLYSNTGETYQQLYAMQTALFYHEQALKMTASPSADLLRNLGVDLVAVGRTEEGLTRLLEALENARHLGEMDAILWSLHSLAEAVFNIGQISEAKALARELLTSAQPLDADRHIIRALLILGHCARAEGDEVAAQEYFHEGFMIAQRAADKSMIWQSHAALAEMLADSKPDIAAVHHAIAVEIVNSILQSIEDEQLRETFRTAPPVARLLDGTP